MVASGEKWPDGSLRPALEDFLGAGAVIAALQPTALASPEASAVAAIFESTRDVGAAVSTASSGRELIESGYAADVEIAVAVDASRIVPLLVDGAFRAA